MVLTFFCLIIYIWHSPVWDSHFEWIFPKNSLKYVFTISKPIHEIIWNLGFMQFISQQFIILWKIGHRVYLGCVPYTRNWVFFANLWNSKFCLVYYSARKKATAMVFIWGDRGDHAVRFEYETASERYLVAEI